MEKKDNLASSGGGRGSVAEEEGRECRGYGKKIKRRRDEKKIKEAVRKEENKGGSGRRRK